MKIVVFFFFAIYLSSCTGSYGNKVVGGDLTVYYNHNGDEQLAKSIALFWKDNDLIIGRKQDVQLVKFEEGYELRIITNEPIEKGQIPFEERKLLMELQRELEANVIKQPLELVICDSGFEPIYNIN